MIPRTWRFRIESPEDKNAGIFPFTDEISITVDSGDPPGKEGDFVEEFRQFLCDFYDTPSVKEIK